AAAVRFLCGPGASFITGQNIQANGGMFLGGVPSFDCPPWAGGHPANPSPKCGPNPTPFPPGFGRWLSLAGMTRQTRGGGNPTRKNANPFPTSISAMTRTTRSPMYTDLALYIDGKWVNGGGRKGEDVLNPATEKPLAHLPHASKADLDEALEAAKKGFALWRA